MAWRSIQRTVTTATVAGAIGLVTWLATMASAPRYSYGPEQNMGDEALFPVLLAAAAVGGLVAPSRAALAGAMLGLPGLVLSPWTAPRGDSDGLWLLIVPTMALFTAVLVAVATASALARRPWADRSWNAAQSGTSPKWSAANQPGKPLSSPGLVFSDAQVGGASGGRWAVSRHGGT